MTNQDAYMNGINQIISNLVNGTQPTAEPGNTARTWFSTNDTIQPPEVNSYMTNQINENTLSTQTFLPTNNWEIWSGTMNASFSEATGEVADWLGKTYQGSLSPDVVPPVVLDWTTSNLPTGL